MKKHSLKILSAVILLLLPVIQGTNAYYVDVVSIKGTAISTGCWTPPSVPDTIAPVGLVGKAWGVTRTFTWQTSASMCVESASIIYQLQVSQTEDFSSLVYQSGWQTATNTAGSVLDDGEYFWRVQSGDGQGHYSDFSLPVRFMLDTSAPVISGISHLIATPENPNDIIATINWNTNEPSTARIEWGKGNFNNHTPLNQALVTSHSFSLSNLDLNSTYQYRVISSDAAGNVSTSAEKSFVIGDDRWGVTGPFGVVINEFLPNPIGSDDALMPAGEWIELFNKDTKTIELTGWYLTDADADHKLPITIANSVSSNPATSGLSLAPGEYLVVFRNGDSDFSLNNDKWGDAIHLWSKYHIVVDEHTYTWLLGDTIYENKSFARIPDGSANWIDPVPTPGEPNRLSESDILALNRDMELNADYHRSAPSLTFSFEEGDFSVYTGFSYLISYRSGDTEKQITGEHEIDRITDYKEQGIIFGTCSAGVSCVYDEAITDIKLTLTLKGVISRTFEKEIPL